MAQRRQPSPHSRGRNRAHHSMMDPTRASTGSLSGGSDPYSTPHAPAPPRSAQRTPYSTNPHSPRSSGESLGLYPPHPGFMPPAPGPPPPGGPGMPGGIMEPRAGFMRGGDVGQGIGRRNTMGARPAARHHNEYEHHPEYDYRPVPPPPPQPRQPPIIHRDSGSSSQSRDMSPPDSGQYSVIPGSAGGYRGGPVYNVGSSNYSGDSYVGGMEPDRQDGYIVPAGSMSHARNGSREYHLSGPLPGEREFRREGTVYHPGGGNRPVLGDSRPPPRERSRPPARDRSRPARERKRSMSRPGISSALGIMEARGNAPEMLDYESPGFEPSYEPGYEPGYFDVPPPAAGRRVTSVGVTTPGASGPLVRARSRSLGPSSSSGAIVRHKSPEQESAPGTSPPTGGGIRLEYGGNAFDITYSGGGGKPLSIGSITINQIPRGGGGGGSTSSSSTSTAHGPSAHTPPSPPIAPLVLPAPPPPGPMPPVAPVMIPAPPPPGTPAPPPAIAPAPQSIMGGGARYAGESDSGVYSMEDASEERLREAVFNMSIDDPRAPQQRHHRGEPPMVQDDFSRGRDRDAMPPPPAPGRARSRSRRRRSQSASGTRDVGEPRWTKISRDIVSRRAVEVLEYEFEEHPDSIMIFQVLEEEEIEELIHLSELIRSGEVRVRRREPERDQPDRTPHKRRERPSDYHGRRRPISIHGYPGGSGSNPGPSANRPPPMKSAIAAPAPPAVPSPPVVIQQATAPAPPPPPSPPTPPAAPQQLRPGPGGLMENPDAPGTYIGYVRNPPKAPSGGYYRNFKR